MPIGRPNRDWVLGIDTSAYTTSVAVVKGEDVVWHARRILPVPEGARGLRAAEAVFWHVRFVPELLAEWSGTALAEHIGLVAASRTPRPVPNSYMPPFTVGERMGRLLATVLGVPFFPTTHQEGHIRAGLYSAGRNPSASFLVLHISGGTTELLRVHPGPTTGYRPEVLGFSDDLFAGQFIDRIGVRLGLPFPAGARLEQLANSAQGTAAVPVSQPRQIDGQWRISFSGPETAAHRLLEQGVDPAAVARGVQEALAETLCRLVARAAAPGLLLVVGGVAANATLRRTLELRFPSADGWDLIFASPELSRDNAVGVAFLGRDYWIKETGHGES